MLLAFGAGSASADVVWLCKPGMADDPCELALDTTFQGTPARVETPPRGPREVDCFYVYPTVSNQLTPNATKARDPELVSIAKFQAARFSQHCRTWAPIYRQSTLASIVFGYAGASGADRELAFQDVLEAWREYLAKDNGGRGVVLIGHSQGTGMLRQLLKREIETHPEQRRRVVSALLIGGTVPAAGNDALATPACTQRAQVGCLVAFSSFAQDPTPRARFGRGGICVDPRPLAGEDGPLRLMLPSEPYALGPIAAGVLLTSVGMTPRADTTWVVSPDRYDGGCRMINGANVLRFEPRPGSRRPMWFPEPNWGTHLVDVNLALEPLVALVGQQGARWAHPDVRLTRRCARGRLRVAIAGREREFVTTRTVRRRGKKLRAVVTLKHGQPERLVLERSLPRC